MGSPTFSDYTAYNEFDFCSSPLGLFEKESLDVRILFDYRKYSESNANNSDSANTTADEFALPNILLGKRNVLYVLFNYEPVWQSEKVLSVSKSVSPMNRFGLVLASQAPSKIIRFGVSAHGFMGTQTQSNSLLPAQKDNSRTALGVDDVGVFLGSQVHPFVRLGIHGGANGCIDSLAHLQTSPGEDRFFYGTVPYLGGELIFGKTDFPVQSMFTLNYASNNFVYVVKGVNNEKPNGNEDALLADSLTWKWQTMGKISSNGVVYQPALLLEYSNCKVQEFAPTDKNYPLSFGAARQDTDWTIGSFVFGLGSSAIIRNWGRAWLEYAHDFLTLSYGPGLKPMQDQSRSYDRIGCGIEGNIHAVSAFNIPPSIELFLRIGYENMRVNSRFGAYHGDEFRLINEPLVPGSQRTSPVGVSPYRVDMDGDVRSSKISSGLGATFFNGILGADVGMGFLTLTSDKIDNGFEFGASISYNLGVRK